jgi:hypothetical protein
MPGARDPNKALASFWMHRDIYTALAIVSKVRDTTMTRFILEALSEKMGFKLDENSMPVGLDLEALAKEAFAHRKKVMRKRRGEKEEDEE